jgi:hypothetical protein
MVGGERERGESRSSLCVCVCVCVLGYTKPPLQSRLNNKKGEDGKKKKIERETDEERATANGGVHPLNSE